MRNNLASKENQDHTIPGTVTAGPLAVSQEPPILSHFNLAAFPRQGRITGSQCPVVPLCVTDKSNMPRVPGTGAQLASNAASRHGSPSQPLWDTRHET